MHTPRFSGQPISAGDFVLLVTPSRPIRTSCENVGTVFPLCLRTQIRSANARTFRQLSHYAQNNSARAHQAERCTAIPETSKKLRTHSKRQTYALGFDSERLTRLCGTGVPFRPLFAPIPSCNVPGEKILPTTRVKCPRRVTARAKLPLTKHRV